MQKLIQPLQAVKTKQGYSIFTVIVVAVFSIWALYDATETEVVLAADGNVHTVKTSEDTVGELLEDLGYDVSQYDELSHDEAVELTDGMEIQYDSARKVLVTVDGETEEYNTVEVTVGQFFEEEDLNFSKHDDISHKNIAVIKDNLEITVDTAFEVTLTDGNESEKVWTTGDTVEDFLVENDIEINKLDIVKPALDKKVKKDSEITIIRVEKDEKEVTEKIPFEVEEKEDASLPKGESKVISAGKEGEIVKTYEVVYENDEVVDRTLIDEDVKEESENKVVAIGTKEKVVEEKAPASTSTPKTTKATNTSSDSSSSNNNKPSGGKTMTMEATAYGADCNGCSGITATGINVKQNPGMKVVAVDPNVIPLGSKVWVEGYGTAIAGDTGGAIKGNRIDVLVKSEAYAASNWGRRTVQVKILD